MTLQVYWLAQDAAGVPPGDDWLSGSEIRVLARLHVPKRRADWRLGRWTAKHAIAAYRGLAPLPEALAAMEVRPAPSGAPEALIDGHPAGLTLSLSHSHGIGFCALAAGRAELGCDVEQVAPRSAAFLSDYFTAEEQDGLERAPAGEQARLSTLLWSAKESALKALGCGLRADTRSVAAVPGEALPGRPAGWTQLDVRADGGRAFEGWWRETGAFVWTLVSFPPPMPPIALSVPAATAAGGAPRYN